MDDNTKIILAIVLIAVAALWFKSSQQQPGAGIIPGVCKSSYTITAAQMPADQQCGFKTWVVSVQKPTCTDPRCTGLYIPADLIPNTISVSITRDGQAISTTNINFQQTKWISAPDGEQIGVYFATKYDVSSSNCNGAELSFSFIGPPGNQNYNNCPQPTMTCPENELLWQGQCWTESQCSNTYPLICGASPTPSATATPTVIATVTPTATPTATSTPSTSPLICANGDTQTAQCPAPLVGNYVASTCVNGQWTQLISGYAAASCTAPTCQNGMVLNATSGKCEAPVCSLGTAYDVKSGQCQADYGLIMGSLIVIGLGAWYFFSINRAGG